ncbi:AGE family epimerase/isomerase [Spirochaetia bacterium 38H-sp]|uniref:Cellobiose 2-epimerase n=1 Tax=Rarispira pelagica TaxID=3141764 RepID=A0ABU9U8V8_9SPIR
MSNRIKQELEKLQTQLKKEVQENILPFWLDKKDTNNGGFFGLIKENTDKTAKKGLVMSARHMWSFSCAYKNFANSEYKDAADHAYDFMIKSLYDREHKGFFWSCDYRGEKEESIKKVYGNAFAIYALAEYYEISKNKQAITIAWETYDILETICKDKKHNGYYEAFDREWATPIPEPLGEEDLGCPKSMNTHLHILEAYSTLYRITGDKKVAEAIENLLKILTSHILKDKVHLGLYFSEDWKRLDKIISYGHDIEASWLLTEAAELLWQDKLPEDFKKLISAITEFYLDYLTENNYSLPNERREDNSMDEERVWWVQAEAFVGMLNAYQLFKRKEYLTTAIKVWEFIENYISDKDKGEWYWSVTKEGIPVQGHPKGGMWKSSYHNTRACIEGINRINHIIETEEI